MDKLTEFLKAGEIVQAKQFIADNRDKAEQIIEALLQYYESDGYARKHTFLVEMGGQYFSNAEQIKENQGADWESTEKLVDHIPLAPQIGPHFPDREGEPLNLCKDREQKQLEDFEKSEYTVNIQINCFHEGDWLTALKNELIPLLKDGKVQTVNVNFNTSLKPFYIANKEPSIIKDGSGHGRDIVMKNLPEPSGQPISKGPIFHYDIDTKTTEYQTGQSYRKEEKHPEEKPIFPGYAEKQKPGVGWHDPQRQWTIWRKLGDLNGTGPAIYVVSQNDEPMPNYITSAGIGMYNWKRPTVRSIEIAKETAKYEHLIGRLTDLQLEEILRSVPEEFKIKDDPKEENREFKTWTLENEGIMGWHLQGRAENALECLELYLYAQSEILNELQERRELFFKLPGGGAAWFELSGDIIRNGPVHFKARLIESDIPF